MDDRKLLELAAKAAGITIPKPNPWFAYSDRDGFIWMNMDGSAVEKRFNPLNDDGDALRLAVKLKMDVLCFQQDGGRPYSIAEAGQHDVDPVYYGKDRHKGDPYAATRRAIVLAAAAIGEAKQ